MALIPVILRNLFDDSLLDSLRPSRFLNKRFGGELYPEEILLALDTLPRRRKRGWRQSELEQDGVVAKKPAGEFQITLDVQQFEPEEISVNATDKCITVEARHEEKDAENGYELRHFVRRYQLPEGHDSGKISSTLSSDGVLTINAPKLALHEPEKGREIPVTYVEKLKEVANKQESQADKNVTLEDLEE